MTGAMHPRSWDALKGDPRTPNLFVIGAPKAGTTSIAKWLGEHSSVFLPARKELGFFNIDYQDGALRNRPRGYLNQYQAGAAHQFRCDGTVDYLASNCALDLIAKLAPDSRFIVSFRNHADLAFSLHQQERIMGNESISDFREAFYASALRRKGKRKPLFSGDAKRLDYETRIQVGRQLKRALAQHQRHQFLFIDFECLRSDAARVWHAICDFLDLPHEDVDMTPENQRKVLRSPLIARSLRLARGLKNRLGVDAQYNITAKVNRAIAPIAPSLNPIDPNLKTEINRLYETDLILIHEFARSGPRLLTDNFFQREL